MELTSEMMLVMGMICTDVDKKDVYWDLKAAKKSMTTELEILWLL